MMDKFPSSFRVVSGLEANDPDVYFYQGQPYKIGEQRAGVYYPRDISDLVKFYPLVVKYAVEKYSIQDDTVAVSLPAETYLNDVRAGKSLQSSLTDSIKKYAHKDAVVLPQGIIAFEAIELEGEQRLVMDGGFNTLNVAVEREGQLVYAHSYFNEFGIRNLLEEIFLPLIKRKFTETPSNLQYLKKVFLSEKLDTGFTVVDVSPEKREAVQLFVSNLLSSISADLKRKELEFDSFAIIGGLAYYVSEVETTKPHFIPKENAEFYNVMGMKRYSGVSSIDFGFGDVKVRV